jgi:hypothetical protein
MSIFSCHIFDGCLRCKSITAKKLLVRKSYWCEKAISAKKLLVRKSYCFELHLLRITYTANYVYCELHLLRKKNQSRYHQVLFFWISALHLFRLFFYVMLYKYLIPHHHYHHCQILKEFFFY